MFTDWQMFLLWRNMQAKHKTSDKHRKQAINTQQCGCLTNISPPTWHETMNDRIESNALDSLSQPSTQTSSMIFYHYAWCVTHLVIFTSTHMLSINLTTRPQCNNELCLQLLEKIYKCMYLLQPLFSNEKFPHFSQTNVSRTSGVH